MYEIKQSKKDFLTPKDVATVLGVMPYSINLQAKKDIRALGFNVCMIGSVVKIPRKAFIDFMEVRNAQ